MYISRGKDATRNAKKKLDRSSRAAVRRFAGTGHHVQYQSHGQSRPCMEAIRSLLRSLLQFDGGHGLKRES